MDKAKLNKILFAMLILFAVCAIVGIICVLLGQSMGLLAIIIGISACFPVLGEIRRQNKK